MVWSSSEGAAPAMPGVTVVANALRIGEAIGGVLG